jgi:adenylate kinase family enzyme
VSLERIAIVGDSCSGKTTLSRDLSARLNLPHIELDRLFWGPSWTPRPFDEFSASIADAVTQTRWIMDGNYSRVMDRIWTRATSLVWLDFPLALVLARGLRRSLRRSLRRESLYSENRETMRRTFFSHDSLLLWIMTSRGPRRRRYQQVLEEGRFPQLEVHRLTSPGKAAQWLEGLGTASNECSLR